MSVLLCYLPVMHMQGCTSLIMPDQGMSAGGLGLQSIVDQLSSILHDSAEKQVSGVLVSSWQCQAASVVTVMTELIFGASIVWQPHVWLDACSKEAPAAETLVPMLEHLLEELTGSQLWGVPSHNANASDDDGPTGQRLSPQVSHSPYHLCSWDSNALIFTQIMEQPSAMRLPC